MDIFTALTAKIIQYSSINSGYVHEYSSLFFSISVKAQWLITPVLCWMTILLVSVISCSCFATSGSWFCHCGQWCWFTFVNEVVFCSTSFFCSIDDICLIHCLILYVYSLNQPTALLFPLIAACLGTKMKVNQLWHL